MPRFAYHDGGRLEAGLAGSAGDCCCRAFAIATGRPYAEVAAIIRAVAAKKERGVRSDPERGVFPRTAHAIARELGGTWVPARRRGRGKRSSVIVAEPMPGYGRFVLCLPKHVRAVVDGVEMDTHFDGNTVLGYWRFNGVG